MPIKWENNILGFVPKTDWLDVPFQITRPEDPADKLFGDIKTDNLVAEWESLAAEFQIPVMAQFHGFDTESQKTFRAPIDTHNIEKGLIKVKIDQSERLRALIRTGVQGDERLYNYVVDDATRLAEQVITRTKVAKNEILATGKVSIKENNLDLVVDYGVPESHLGLTLDFGAGATADVPTQLQNIVDQASADGQILSGIYTSKKMLNKLRQNADIQKAVNGNIGAGALVRRNDLEDYLSTEFGINEIVINDFTYGASAEIASSGRPAVTSARYYPQNKVTFFARTQGREIGVGLWGDAPEADVAKLLEVSGSTVSPYVAITQWSEEDPAVLWTKASALFIPVLYNPYSLYIATERNTPAGA